MAGVDLNLVVRLRVFELDHAVEREPHFGLVEDVEQNHVVPAVPQPPQRLQHGLRLGQQIAEQHHQAAMLEHGRDLVQAAGDVGLAGRLADWPAATAPGPICVRFDRAGRLWRIFSSNVISPTGSC